MSKRHWLKSPWSVLAGMMAGVLIGLFGRPALPYLEPIGEMYLAILQMCVIPIMTAALVLSVSKLLRSNAGRRFIGKIVGTLLLLLLMVSTLAAGLALTVPAIRQPSDDVKRAIAQSISAHDSRSLGFQVIRFSGDASPASAQNGMAEFLINAVPRNIFTALAGNQTVQIIFFFTVLGVLIALLDDAKARPIVNAFESFYLAFQKLVGYTTYLLPIGLCATIAPQVAGFGASLLFSVLLLIFAIIATSALVFIGAFVAICIKARCSPATQFKALGQTIFIALGTKNSFAAIPSALVGLTRQLSLDETQVNAVLPLGISLCRFGNVMIFALSSIFACGLYGVQLGLPAVASIILGSILAGVASSGAPGIVARSMVAMVLAPLMVPTQAVVAILSIIDPVIDPFSTLINVYPNCAAAAMVAAPSQATRRRENKDIEGKRR